MTPAQIAKLTEQAKRGKAMMAASEKAAEEAGRVFDSYATTLATFNSHVARVKTENAALTAMMADFGNAESVINATFQDTSVNVRPAEGAELAKVSEG